MANKAKAPARKAEPARQGVLFAAPSDNVGALVKQMASAMQLRKLSAARLAAALGTVEPAVRDWLNGSAMPGVEFQERIKRWLAS